MFIGQRHSEDSKRRRRDMFIKRNNNQYAPQQHATPMELAACSAITLLKVSWWE
jgi:hypothetical protein